MNYLSRHKTRAAVLAGALLVAAVWLGPGYLSTERYRGRLEAGLARVLKRPITFSSASFRLLPRPGFSLVNAVIREHPSFGSEPFARVDRLDADLRWSSLWRGRLDFARLYLERPSFNIVRDDRGEWNVERLLLESGVADADRGRGRKTAAASAFELDAEDARLNFKVGEDKKTLAVVDLRAHLRFDPASGLVEFRLAGNPVRSDLPVPAPGVVELAGEWKPGADLAGSLNATLRTRKALLYNWVPLVTGKNPEIYGVIDADVRLAGSLRVVKVEGEGQLTQLHRWDILPPSDPLPAAIRFRGEFDRTRGRAMVESLDANFGNSHIHLNGAVDGIPSAPELDVVVALERSRLEDFVALSRRLWGPAAGLGLSGRADGLMSIQGPWAERRYGGFLSARDGRLETPSGRFALSEVALRIDRDGARLAPVKIALGPRLDLVVEGAIYPKTAAGKNRREIVPPRYEVRLSAKSVGLGEVVRFGRALGVRAAQSFDAQGAGTASFVLAGSAWPLSRPSLAGRVEIRAARLLVPGLTEPLNIPRARIQVSDDRVVVDPVTAVMGTSVFTGRLEHQRNRANPWRFDVKASSLRLEQGALWFDVLGHRPPLALLDRIPGLGSVSARRSVASTVFSRLNASGQFESPAVSFRTVRLEDFHAMVEVSDRILTVSAATFRVAGGRGKGRVTLNLTSSPARVEGEVALAAARLQAFAVRLPAALRGARGSLSGTATFETRGLTLAEMSTGLGARGSVQLKNVGLGDFDPLQSLAREEQWGVLEPAHGEATLRGGTLDFTIRDRRVNIASQPLELEGARLRLAGSLGFGGDLRLDVDADLRRIARRWTETGEPSPTAARSAQLRLTGSLDKPLVQGDTGISQARR
ncbi:MAG: AsmA family protein [Acidobacteriia bacterium]|nr:AsmA family protein [Terriglobia bacterium]